MRNSDAYEYSVIPHEAVVFKFITHTQHMDCNGLQTQMAHVCFYISAGVGGIDFIGKLVLLFLRLFLLSRNAFGDEFLTAEVFYREH